MADFKLDSNSEGEVKDESLVDDKDEEVENLKLATPLWLSKVFERVFEHFV